MSPVADLCSAKWIALIEALHEYCAKPGKDAAQLHVLAKATVGFPPYQRAKVRDEDAALAGAVRELAKAYARAHVTRRMVIGLHVRAIADELADIIRTPPPRGAQAAAEAAQGRLHLRLPYAD